MTGSRGGREISQFLATASCFPGAKLERPVPTALVERNNTGKPDFTASTRTRSEESILSGVGEKQVEAGHEDSFVASNSEGAVANVSSTSSQDDRPSRATSTLVREDRLSVASLEQQRQEAADKVSFKYYWSGGVYLRFPFLL